MIEKILLAISPFLAPVFAAMLGASRRNRLRRRVQQYLELADSLDVHDPERAKLVRDLAGEGVENLVELERRSLQRRFDPWALVALLILLVPSVVLIAWAWTWDEDWKWLVIVVAGLWTLVWGGVGLGQLFKHPETPADNAADEPSVA